VSRIPATRWLMLGGLVFTAFVAGSIRVSGAVYPITYHAGWNLSGAPEGTRYAGADGFLYTLQPGDDGYEQLSAGTAATAGFGYWVYFPVARTVLMTDGSSYTSTALPAGQWVTIGNPSGFRTLPVSGADAIFTWDPGRGYRSVASLLPGQGAWAFSAGGGLLTIGIADDSGESDPPTNDIPSGPVGALDASGCRTGEVKAGVYHGDRLQVIDPCRTVTGIVRQVRVEPDGDYHLNLIPDSGQDGLLNGRNITGEKGTLVIEVIPADQREVPPPLAGDHVQITGAFVLDRDHGWQEIHPAWRITVVPP
jgi:hypothetical protein